VLSVWFNGPRRLTTAAGLVTAGLAHDHQGDARAPRCRVLSLRCGWRRGSTRGVSRDFPFLWEELRVPVPYTADRAAAERILLEAARKHTTHESARGAEALREPRRRYFADSADLDPRVYWRLTDRWLELALRFVNRERGVRAVKDAMSREILAGLSGVAATEGGAHPTALSCSSSVTICLGQSSTGEGPLAFAPSGG
jgi:hypothetical protein